MPTLIIAPKDIPRAYDVTYKEAPSFTSIMENRYPITYKEAMKLKKEVIKKGHTIVDVHRHQYGRRRSVIFHCTRCDVGKKFTLEYRGTKVGMDTFSDKKRRGYICDKCKRDMIIAEKQEKARKEIKEAERRKKQGRGRKPKKKVVKSKKRGA